MGLGQVEEQTKHKHSELGVPILLFIVSIYTYILNGEELGGDTTLSVHSQYPTKLLQSDNNNPFPNVKYNHLKRTEIIKLPHQIWQINILIISETHCNKGFGTFGIIKHKHDTFAMDIVV